MPWRTYAALLPMAALATAATAAQGDFLQRFEGQWSGSGTVQPSFEESTHNVSCQMTGNEQGEAVSVDGKCRAYLIFSRDIGVDLREQGNGTYTGTYVGSPVGPASLKGTREGDALNLTIQWPKEVNGDLEARMRLTAGGDGSLRIMVFDQVAGEGEQTKITDISLSKG